ncbi:hypothetical protein I6F33_37695, partial [Bradyrhizobium sp. BRP20]|uniref:hypothetical protein n=1 Tax=Bradyrhizobium sp. BRP20 TaxID=2793822 RepID=UPI001CD7634B
AFALWRYRAAWLLSLAAFAGAMALFNLAGLALADTRAQYPEAWAAIGGAVLMATAFAQMSAGILLKRRFGGQLAWPLYAAAGAAALPAIWGALPYNGPLAAMVLAAAALAALLASAEERQPLAWLSVLLATGGALLLHRW